MKGLAGKYICRELRRVVLDFEYRHADSRWNSVENRPHDTHSVSLPHWIACLCGVLHCRLLALPEIGGRSRRAHPRSDHRITRLGDMGRAKGLDPKLVETLSHSRDPQGSNVAELASLTLG